MTSILNSQIEAQLNTFENKDTLEDNFVLCLKTISEQLKAQNLTMISDANDLVNYLNSCSNEESSVVKANVRVVDLLDVDYFTGVVKDKINNQPKCQIFGNDNNLQETHEKTKETLDWENPVLITRRICKLKLFNSVDKPVDENALEFVAALYDNHDGLKINHIYTVRCEIIHSLIKDQLQSSGMMKEDLGARKNDFGELDFIAEIPAIKIIDSEIAQFQNFYGMFNEIMDRRETKLGDQSKQSSAEIKNIAGNLKQQLSSIIKDDITSKLVLFNMVSHGLKRDSNNEPVDVISLNIFNAPADVSSKLDSFMQKVMPSYHSLVLTADKMNEKSYYSRKNFETNKLELGSCDIFSGSSLFLDETNLTEGKLVTIGVKNVNFLNEVISNQYLPIDYEYSQVKTDISCPVLCFSTDKSILDFTLKVPYAKIEADEFLMDCETVESTDYNSLKSLVIYSKYVSDTFVLTDDDKK